MTMMDTICEFVAKTEFEDIPDETVSYTRSMTSKIVAAMLVGAKTLAGQRAVEYGEANGNGNEVGAIGTKKKFSLEDAAFVNGISCHAAELEDDQFPSATSDITIFPVVFPLAEKLKTSGKSLLTASAIGIEVMHRIGMFPLSSKGITDLPFYGVIGAAVTAAKILNLPTEQIKSAIGISLGRASGFIANFGTDAHYVESASACRDGLMAARLAKLGMTGTADLEGWLTGVCKGTNFDLNKVVEGLGEPTWRVHQTWIKKYPCCFLTHRHIDMMLDILAEKSVKEEEIKNIDIHVGPVDYTCNRPFPIDTEDARFSFHHILGAIMVDGDIDSHHFTKESLADKRIQDARKKVNVIRHDDWPSEFMSGLALLKITLQDGTVISREKEQSRGGPKEPVSDAEVEALYRKYTRPVLTEAQIDKTWEMISKLENTEDLSELIDLLVNP